MTEEFDARLRERMLRLEDEMPAMSTKTTAGRPLRWSASALVLVGVLGMATGAAASTAFQEAVGSAPGVFSSQGALYCSRIQQMAPVDADPLLRELGYEVTWQLEDRDANTYVRSATPPSDGFIVEGVIIGRDLVLVVERGEDVEQVGDPCPFGS